MKNINKFLFAILGLILVTACESTEFEELLDNPNQLNPDQISVNDGLNSLQFGLNSVFNGTQGIGSRATRIEYMFGSTYQNAFPPGTGEGAWNTAYASIMSDASIVLPKTIEFQSPLQEGIIRVILAYTYMTLVDYWGDVPFDEALQGVGNFNPTLTAGATVYDAALTELNAAIATLEAGIALVDPADVDEVIPTNVPGGAITNSFFFENATTDLQQAEAWIRFANSLKFKYYMTLGDVTNMNILIADNNMIDDNSESVAFRYQPVNDPESRNGTYVADYGDGTPGNYMSNSYMFAMIDAGAGGGGTLGFDDPRADYYFYRQTDSFPTATDVPSLTDALPCADDSSPYAPGVAFCAFGAGYWGRDHGDASGIPPDSDTRTAYGAYPIGGSTDTNNPDSVGDGDGLNGAGISPILMASQMDLIRAEAAFRLGTTDNAQALLESGIDKSITYVTSFDGTAATNPTAYRNAVSANYPGNEMQTIAEEMWKASFRSGNEMFNMYRRTGFPNNLQPHLLGTGGGAFPRSLFYPVNTANLNLSIAQKADLSTLVFWDNGSTVLQ